MKVINVVYDESDIVSKSLKTQIEDVSEILTKCTNAKKIENGLRPHVDGSVIGTLSIDDGAIVINFVHESLWIMDENYADETYGKNLIPFNTDSQKMVRSIHRKF